MISNLTRYHRDVRRAPDSEIERRGEGILRLLRSIEEDSYELPPMPGSRPDRAVGQGGPVGDTAHGGGVADPFSPPNPGKGGGTSGTNTTITTLECPDCAYIMTLTAK
jgi:hypothetical protein